MTNFHLEQADVGRLDDCYRVFEGSEIFERYFAGTQKLQNTLRSGAERGQLYVALTPGGEVAGAMKIVPGGFCGLYPYLSLIGVSALFQGGGAGRFLMAEFENMARADGARRTALMVSHLNTRAIAFYEKLGYHALGLLENVVKEGLHEYVMLKDLAPAPAGE